MKLELPFQLNKYEIKQIDDRLKEFKALHKAGNDQWFSELCFCILTANAQAKRAISIQEELKTEGFLEKTEQEIADVIKKHKHRFHNVKAKYIVLARKYKSIKDILKPLDTIQARDFLVKNIKGLGYKEASHFLRNVGYSEVAIIDRHILKFLYKYKFIDAIAKVITKKIYLKFEEILKEFGLPLDKLDLMIWYHMTGKILK